jgi:hypothetical protein
VRIVFVIGSEKVHEDRHEITIGFCENSGKQGTNGQEREIGSMSADQRVNKRKLTD